MLRLEETRLPEQKLNDARTLSKVASERVILRLTSFLPDPLTREGADSFNHVLRGERKGNPDNQLTFRAGGSFFIVTSSQLQMLKRRSSADIMAVSVRSTA